MTEYSVPPLKSDGSEVITYSYADFSAYLYRDWLSQYPNYSAVSHWHDDVEFIVIISGSMDYNINGKIVRLKPGNGIFVNSRQLHYGFSLNHEECNFICILLHPMLLCTSPILEKTYITPVLASRLSYTILQPEIPWQKQVLQLLMEMQQNQERDQNLLVLQSLFFQIWNLLYSNLPKELPPPAKSNQQLSELKDMIGFIQTHYKDKLSLNDIAAAGKVCKSSCCARFQKYLRQTPISYLIEYRLKRSLDLMNTTDLSITEISMETGFSGVSYFTETFRKHYGCSPREYRKKIPQTLI